METIAKFTRLFHPRGTERLLRLFYSPDKRQNDYLETIIPYDKDLEICIDTRSFIEWQIFFKGYYELPTINLIKKYLPKGGVFIDVGANIGNVSLIAAKIASKVIAIEPVQKFIDRIKRNFAINKMNNVSILPFAASDKAGIVSFYAIKEGIANGMRGSFYQDHAKNETEEIQVEAKTLDEMLKDETRIDFIKIDTEGNDGRVILGSLKIIEKHHPIIIFEYVEESWKSSGIEFPLIEDKLNSLGYKLKRIDDSNILCLPT